MIARKEPVPRVGAERRGKDTWRNTGSGLPPIGVTLLGA